MADSTANLFLHHSTAKLDQMTGFLQICLARLVDEQVWERHGEHENTVGNLVLHLCGNMRQWIMHGVGGAVDVRVRNEEFNRKNGPTARELSTLLAETAAEAKAIIASLPHERLQERITPQGKEVSVLDAIYQVVGHLQQHTGQIILLTKQMTGRDLDLTMPRPR